MGGESPVTVLLDQADLELDTSIHLLRTGMWGLQHSCVLRCAAKAQGAGTIQPLCRQSMSSAAQKGCAWQKLCNKACFCFTGPWEFVLTDNLEPSIIQFTSSFPLRTEVPLNCSTRILTFSPLLGSVLLLAARQRCQSVPSSRAVKQSRVWLRELQQQLLDKCFPYHLLLANNASSCRRDHGAAAFVTFLKRSWQL